MNQEQDIHLPKEIREAMTTNQSGFLTPSSESKIIDQFLLQSGGIAVGFVSAIVLSVLAAKWFGIFDLIGKWIEKGEEQVKAIQTLASSVEKLVEEGRVSLSNQTAQLNELHEIRRDLTDVKRDVTDIKRELDDVARKLP